MAGLPVAEAIRPLLQGRRTGQPVAMAAHLLTPLESNERSFFHEHAVCSGWTLKVNYFLRWKLTSKIGLITSVLFQRVRDRSKQNGTFFLHLPNRSLSISSGEEAEHKAKILNPPHILALWNQTLVFGLLAESHDSIKSPSPHTNKMDKNSEKRRKKSFTSHNQIRKCEHRKAENLRSEAEDKNRILRVQVVCCGPLGQLFVPGINSGKSIRLQNSLNCHQNLPLGKMWTVYK